ncbi:MAG: Gfo/Idh/MocA family oxidoreductase [Syntrophotaleaceae bacterium]
MNKFRAAVIGTGYLGRFHAQKYAALDEVELVGAVDIDREKAAAVAAETGTTAYRDYRDLLHSVDMVSIAVPTSAHFQVASDFLDAGCHVLLEKPITPTLDDADKLIALAKNRGLVLQVGHLERFNPAVLALQDELTRPMFVESHRLAAFRPRGTDVNVVFDLMIHDIDIILTMVHSPVKQISAVGVPILSDEVDIANARIEFENGCVANVTASRVSRQAMRKIRIFQSDAYFSIDYEKRKISVCRKGGAGIPVPGLPGIIIREKEFGDGDSLMAEIRSFLNAVKSGSPPVVSGEDGKRALELVLEISRKLGASRT